MKHLKLFEEYYDNSDYNFFINRFKTCDKITDSKSTWEDFADFLKNFERDLFI